MQKLPAQMCTCIYKHVHLYMYMYLYLQCVIHVYIVHCIMLLYCVVKSQDVIAQHKNKFEANAQQQTSKIERFCHFMHVLQYTVLQYSTCNVLQYTVHVMYYSTVQYMCIVLIYIHNTGIHVHVNAHCSLYVHCTYMYMYSNTCSCTMVVFEQLSWCVVLCSSSGSLNCQRVTLSS